MRTEENKKATWIDTLNELFEKNKFLAERKMLVASSQFLPSGLLKTVKCAFIERNRETKELETWVKTHNNDIKITKGEYLQFFTSLPNRFTFGEIEDANSSLLICDLFKPDNFDKYFKKTQHLESKSPDLSSPTFQLNREVQKSMYDYSPNIDVDRMFLEAALTRMPDLNKSIIYEKTDILSTNDYLKIDGSALEDQSDPTIKVVKLR
jgi:hypothetical protein